MKMNDRYFVHAGGTMNSEAVADVAGCLPLIIPDRPALCLGRGTAGPVRRLPADRRAAERASQRIRRRGNPGAWRL
jgi:hypothetical protein